MYKKVDTNLNFVEREKEIRDFWKANDIAQKAIDQREGCDTFTFYDGPPTANGKPHIGHVLTRVIKDMLPRFASMKGKKVLRKAGWDTHGLPGRARSREAGRHQRQGADRGVRHRAVRQEVP